MYEYRALMRGIERHAQREWEIARWQAFYNAVFSFGTDAKKLPKTPQAMFPFPWDKPEKKKKISSRIKPFEIKQLTEIYKLFYDGKSKRPSC